jgi:hypothetical protein
MRRYCFLLTLTLAACASRPHDRSPLETAVTQPLRDTRVKSDKIPEVLQLAVSAPYSTEKLLECAQIDQELARLNKALGPDVDDPQKTSGTGALLAGLAAQAAVSSLIPGLGLVRVLTGAEQHQLRLNAAILSGSVRRGFLKGLMNARSCRTSLPAGG